MENKDLAQKIQAILSETPKMIHKCIEDGEQARAFRILSDYANQRVIEALENLKEDSSDYVEWQGGHGVFVPIEDIQEIIEELKQE